MKKSETIPIPPAELTANDYLKLISSIPPEQFIEGVYGSPTGPCCVLGQVIKAYCPSTAVPNDDLIDTKLIFQYQSYLECEPAMRLRILSSNYMIQNLRFHGDIADVNNLKGAGGYKQDTIKERVVACLTDMIAAGY